MIYVLAGLNAFLIVCALWNEARINRHDAEIRRLERDIDTLRSRPAATDRNETLTRIRSTLALLRSGSVNQLRNTRPRDAESDPP